MRSSFFTLISLVALVGCVKDDTNQESTEMTYYRAAQADLRSGRYNDAVEKLQLLESRFPFGRYAEQAQLEIIFAYYRSAQPESARSAADRFIRLHPQHPNVDYAYYLRGIASFEEDQGIFSSLLMTDPTKRDPGAARDSFNDFSILLQKFPGRQYSPDARKKMKYLKNLLAESEIDSARYYIKRGAYIAAANRGHYVFENFQGTTAVPDALATIVEAYRLLGLTDLADKTMEVLIGNFPNHRSIDSDGNFVDSWAIKRNGRSLLNIISLGLWG